MMKYFKVSVIIPVYNAAKYVRKAVESAVSLDDVGEVILVDDAGPDNSLTVCRQLIEEYPGKVILLRHPDHANHGPGASRNLGIKYARFDYIAFLDADDYYLPNRFARDREILMNDPAADGVYNCIGNHYYSDNARRNYLSKGHPEEMTLSAPVPPQELIYVLLWQHPTVRGEFSTISLTVRRSLLDRVGQFHTELPLQQDTHMWKRMAAVGRLLPGNLETPVAMRGVHDDNRMVDRDLQRESLRLWWKDLRRWFRRSDDVPPQVWDAFDRAYHVFQVRNQSRPRALGFLLKYVLIHPRETIKSVGFFDQAIFRIFGKNWVTLHATSWKNRRLNHVPERELKPD